MSCICNSPVRPEFKDSYNDLLDKPKINGVTLNGNLTAADLGIKAGAQFKIVPQLPITNIDEATVYLVPVQVGQTDNIYQEWIYINNRWEKIGEPISIQEAGGGVFTIPANSKYVLDNDASYNIDFNFLTSNFPNANFKRGCTYVSWGDSKLTIAAPESGFASFAYANIGGGETIKIVTIDSAAFPDGFSFDGTFYIANDEALYAGVIQNVFFSGNFNPASS